MTSRRKVALRKAQLASAKKRKRMSKKKKVAIASGAAIGVLGAAGLGGAAVGRHKKSGSKLSVKITSGEGLVGPIRPFSAGTIHRGPALDIDRVPYTSVTVSTRAGFKGKRIKVQYDHRSLTGSKVPVPNPFSRKSSSSGKSAAKKQTILNADGMAIDYTGRAVPSGSVSDSRVVTKKWVAQWMEANGTTVDGRKVVRTRVKKNSLAGRFMADLDSNKYKVIFENG